MFTLGEAREKGRDPESPRNITDETDTPFTKFRAGWPRAICRYFVGAYAVSEFVFGKKKKNTTYASLSL